MSLCSILLLNLLSPISGSASVIVSSITQTASGTQDFVGSSLIDVRSIQIYATGTQAFVGTATQSINSLALDASGSQTFSGATEITLSSSFAATGEQLFIGTANESISSLTSAASGTQEFTGAVSQNISSTIAANGIVANPISGSASITIPFSIDSTGTQLFTGTSEIVLPTAQISVVSKLIFSGDNTIVIPSISHDGVANQSFDGAVDITIPLALSSVGSAAYYGSIAIPPLIINVDGKVVNPVRSIASFGGGARWRREKKQYWYKDGKPKDEEDEEEEGEEDEIGKRIYMEVTSYTITHPKSVTVENYLINVPKQRPIKISVQDIMVKRSRRR